MLSELSPIRALRSMSWMGSTPYRSRKAAVSYTLESGCPIWVEASRTVT